MKTGKNYEVNGTFHTWNFVPDGSILISTDPF